MLKSLPTCEMTPRVNRIARLVGGGNHASDASESEDTEGDIESDSYSDSD